METRSEYEIETTERSKETLKKTKKVEPKVKHTDIKRKVPRKVDIEFSNLYPANDKLSQLRQRIKAQQSMYYKSNISISRNSKVDILIPILILGLKGLG